MNAYKRQTYLPIALVGGGAILGSVLGWAAVTHFAEPEKPASSIAQVQDTDIHFQVQSLGVDGQPGETYVVYSPDGKTNINVGRIGDVWETTIPFNRFASVTFHTGPDTIADCAAHEYNQVVSSQSVGANAWQQCQAK